MKYLTFLCRRQFKKRTMKQFIYVDKFKVVHSDRSNECSDKVKLTSYKKKRAYDAKHKPTERAAKRIDASLERERTYLLNKAKNALRYERRKNR